MKANPTYYVSVETGLGLWWNCKALNHHTPATLGRELPEILPRVPRCLFIVIPLATCKSLATSGC